MEISVNFNNSENRVYLDKISKLLRDLNPSTATLQFVKQMVPLSALLSEFDQRLDNFYPVIDENAQDPSYFLAAYFDTRNLTTALCTYRIVRSLTRYILLLDRFYETANDKHALLAKQVLKSVNELLKVDCDAQYLTYSIDYLLRQFSAFWKFEQVVKRRMLDSNTFSYSEIRHFNLSKSSDASLIYAKVLDAKLPSFNEKVALVLHYNQALLDIQDDLEDIEEDVEQDMPNVFVMAAAGNIPYSRIKKTKHNTIRKVVLARSNSSRKTINRLVDELQDSAMSIPIPKKFAFLKSLSDRYGDTVRRKISLAHS